MSSLVMIIYFLSLSPLPPPLPPLPLITHSLQPTDPDIENITFTLVDPLPSLNVKYTFNLSVVAYFKPGAKMGLELKLRQFAFTESPSNTAFASGANNRKPQTHYLSIPGDENDLHTNNQHVEVRQTANFVVELLGAKQLELEVSKWKLSLPFHEKLVYQPGLAKVTPM